VTKILRADGFSPSDIRQMQHVAGISRLGGEEAFEALLQEMSRLRERRAAHGRGGDRRLAVGTAGRSRPPAALCRRACTAIRLNRDQRPGRVEPLDTAAIPECGAWPRWRRAACGVRRPIKALGRALPASRPGLHRDRRPRHVEALDAA
jgi:hypothetical protein